MSKKPERFLFNRHNFDDGHLTAEDLYPDLHPEEEEEPEDLPPPPPTFSEEELETAKTKAFNEGKQQGATEEKQRQDQALQTVLEKIAHALPDLTQQEKHRIARYEEHALHLTQIIFEKLFPYTATQHGLEELTTAIERVIKHNTRAPHIAINLNPEQCEIIQKIYKMSP